MFGRAICLVGIPLALAACAGAEPLRYVVDPVIAEASTRVRTSARTISIAEVSLPAYAKEPSLFVEGEGSALQALENADWGDDPGRAMSNALVRELTEITGADVAAEPWPLGGVPEAEIRVRVSEMVVRADGLLSLSGHYAIRRDEARDRNAIELFSLQVPSASAAPADVVRAHGAAWRELAAIIAKALR